MGERSGVTEETDGVTIERNITLAEVRACKPDMIWYGATTCWWTHDQGDLREAGRLGRHELPSDPRGGVLFQTDKPMDFLAQAEANAEHYGEHGLEAFMAAHHRNCRRGLRPWCLRSWQEYGAVLDAEKR